MKDSDVEILLKSLKIALKKSDWDLVYEAVDFIEEFIEGDDEDI